MKYMLLLAHDPELWGTDPGSPEDGVLDDWGVYTRALHEAGVLVWGAGLASPHTATSVRVKAAQRALTDGPFAETREHLIGFYVIEVPDLDAALEWAARVPSVRTGVVEVRPLGEGQTTDDTLAALGLVPPGAG